MNILVIAVLIYFVLCAIGALFFRKKFLAASWPVKVLITGPLVVGMFYSVWSMNNARNATFVVWDPNLKKAIDLPVSVNWGSVEWGDHSKGFEKAVSYWNKAVGCPLFELAPNPRLEVLASSGTPCDDMERPLMSKDAGAAFYDCGNGTGEIHIQKAGDVRQSYQIMVHELGHALGLIDEPCGVMQPITTEMVTVLACDKHLDALKQQYCN